MATLTGCEMGLQMAGVKLSGSGVQEAMRHLSTHPSKLAPHTAE
jgi:alanine-glyoxylate transaminase/serine-glyoxylate transaminase/serine-pyruvate transaminase